jgi:alanine racemase
MNIKYQYPAWLEIKKKTIIENLIEIKRVTKNAEQIVMLKGNAYGMGIKEIGRVLIEQGIKMFGVVGISEALTLKKVSKSIVVADFEPLTKYKLETYFKQKICLVISSVNDYRLLVSSKNVYSKRIKAIIKINTGLNRLGLSPKEAYEVLEDLSKYLKITILGLVTTLSENEEKDLEQISVIKIIQGKLQEKNVFVPFISYASSQSLITLNLNSYDVVRPGISLTGIYPDKESETKKKVLLKPIFKLKSYIAQIKNIGIGENILYKDMYRSKRKMLIAMLPVGYYLGYPLLKSRRDVLVQGNRCPVLGVTMSATIVDISKIEKIAVGELVTLYGKQGNEEIKLIEVARETGLSQYYLLTCLKSDLKRIYFN